MSRPCGGRVRAPNRITRAELDKLSKHIPGYKKMNMDELCKKLKKSGRSTPKRQSTPKRRSTPKCRSTPKRKPKPKVKASPKRRSTPKRKPKPKVKASPPRMVSGDSFVSVRRKKSEKSKFNFNYEIDGKKDHIECYYTLGTGGYGNVYFCESNVYGDVAVKIFHSKSKRVLKEIERELYFLRKTVPYRILASGKGKEGKVKDKVFIVAELLDGRDLRTIYKGLTNQDLINMSKDVLKTLHKAHNLGIVHMDIKPENIVYDKKQKKYILID